MSASDYLTQLFSYEGQIVVVTGGTGVLGGALCDGFGKAGGHVVVSGRSEERGLERVQAIQDAGGSAEFIAVDVLIVPVFASVMQTKRELPVPPGSDLPRPSMKLATTWASASVLGSLAWSTCARACVCV